LAGKTTGQGWLYTDWKCLQNSSATSAAGYDGYHETQAG
jgi:hypothetical protein